MRCALENLLVTHERDFGNQGYALLMNRDPARRAALHEALLAQYARLDDFLRQHGGNGPWLFERFGWAGTVFTPLFMRFWFLDYYGDWALPEGAAYGRVCGWVQAGVAHPAAQQVCRAPGRRATSTAPCPATRHWSCWKRADRPAAAPALRVRRS